MPTEAPISISSASFLTTPIFIYFSNIICVTNTAQGERLSYIPNAIHIDTKTKR